MATVLLVEDNALVRSPLAFCLIRLCGCTVLEAADEGEALRLCRTHRGSIDLLLTDLRLPGPEGLRFAEQVSARRPGIKFVFISGTAEAVEELGAAFLEKPFTLADVRRKLKEVFSTTVECSAAP
jgi:CheY-like chemotaxis protein